MEQKNIIISDQEILMILKRLNQIALICLQAKRTLSLSYCRCIYSFTSVHFLLCQSNLLLWWLYPMSFRLKPVSEYSQEYITLFLQLNSFAIIIGQLKDMNKEKDLVCLVSFVRSTLSMMFGWLYFYEK